LLHYFDIFAAMKKYSSVIFLSLLVILAFTYARPLSVQACEAASSVNFTANTGFSAHIHYPETEIEHITIQSSAVSNGHYVVQKTSCFYPAVVNNRFPVTVSVLYSSTIFEEKELFGNTYLSHNYPSHNFW